MTHYTKANEDQRNDRALKDLVYMEVMNEYSSYEKSATWLQKIYDNTSFNRAEVYGLLKKAIWHRDLLQRVLSKYPEDDFYIGNQAAFLSSEEVIKLKEKYAID